MSGLTPRINLITPETGEPDLAMDVASNMAIIDSVSLDPSQFEELTGGGSTELHTHASVAHADHSDTASALSPGRNINGVLFNGTQNITITADPNAHTHLASHLTDVDAGLQLRRIYTGTATNPATVVTSPRVGDLYIRIR